jgi:phage/conjugal plasmid C-4 type zinc finger TraR family protein
MDDMDFCQQINEELISDALATQQRNRPTGPSLEFCCICGGKIPEARRKAAPGCTKCISCQAEFESMHGKWGER